MYIKHLFHSATYATLVAFLIVAFMAVSFFALEPSIGHSQISEEFTVSQTITDEVSFVVAPTDVTMVGSIAGLTGGHATGTTKAVVTTNDPQGYNMTLSFSTTTAMHKNGAPANVINNYTPATVNVPDYNWITNGAGGAAEFGYSVMASTSSEINQSFKNNGSSCNQSGGSQTLNKCWLNSSTTPKVIISTSAPVAYSTTTIKFKVAVPPNPSPVVPSGVYVATGTLTIAGNP